MRTFDPVTLGYLQSAGGKRSRLLAHVRARRRIDDVVETMGLWSGETDRNFTIDGETRAYHRAAGLMSMDAITAQPGMDVAFTEFRLSPIDEAVRVLLGNYDLRYAPVELHRALFWPETGELVAEPHRIFKGWIDGAAQEVPEVGGSPELKFSLASATLALNRTLAFKKSDPALSAARSGDRFRRYTDVGSVMVAWGEKRASERNTVLFFGKPVTLPEKGFQK